MKKHCITLDVGVINILLHDGLNIDVIGRFGNRIRQGEVLCMVEVYNSHEEDLLFSHLKNGQQEEENLKRYF